MWKKSFHCLFWNRTQVKAQSSVCLISIFLPELGQIFIWSSNTSWAARLSSPFLGALVLMHLLPALNFGVEIWVIAQADGYCICTAGICMFKYLLVRRNGEFNTCVLKVCQPFGAWIIWYIVFWNVSWETVTVTWICAENFSVWYDVLMKKAAVAVVMPVTSLLMTSGLPKSVMRN